MVSKKPKQSPKNFISFINKVEEYLQEKDRSPSWLARQSRLSKTTITKMLNNTDYRGNGYCPDRRTVVAICLALRLSRERRWELFYMAFPEERIINEAMDNGYSVDETNIALENLGAKPLIKA